MTAAVSLPAFAIRDWTPADRNYVLKWWRAGERDSSGHLEGQRFALLQDAVMDGILARKTTSVRIAHPSDSPDTIAGFLVQRAPVGVLHKGPGRYMQSIGPAPIVYYVHTHRDGRRVGIARLLLGELAERRDVLYTSRPPRECVNGVWLSSNLIIPRGWTYCPRAAFVEVP